MTRWKPAVGFEVLVVAGDQIVELGIDVVQHGLLELVEVDVAGAHHGGRIAIVDQRQKQVFERRVFVVSFVGERERLMERLFEALRESRHFTSLLLHHALQRMLMLTGEIHDLRHLGLGHFERKDPAFAHAVVVDV